MGRKPVAAKCLEWLCTNQEIEVVGVITDSHLSVSPTNDIAIKYKIPVYSREEVERGVSNGSIYFDLALSMVYWQKVRQPIISQSSKGVINFHPAPLPDFKGTAGYNMAILNGLDKWAVSAHYIDESFDTGPIIDVDYFSISPDTETARSLESKTQPRLLSLFKNTVLRAINQNELLPMKENKGGIYISREEMEAMKEIRNGDDIERKIRAFWFPPYDGAYIIINGQKFTLVNNFILQQLADPLTSNLFSPDAN